MSRLVHVCTRCHGEFLSAIFFTWCPACRAIPKDQLIPMLTDVVDVSKTRENCNDEVSKAREYNFISKRG
jgi:hypothetical protein